MKVLIICIYHNSHFRFMRFNPFPLADAFQRICSRRLLKTLMQKVKLLMMSNFSLLQQCLQLYLMINLSCMEIIHSFFNVFKVFCCRFAVSWKGLRNVQTIKATLNFLMFFFNGSNISYHLLFHHLILALFPHVDAL